MTTYLFTTLPTNDLGLLTRSLPVAAKLAGQGHTVLFCSPGQAPSKLIAEAGLDNLVPKHLLFYVLASDLSVRGILRALRTSQQRLGLRSTASQLVRTAPPKFASATSEVWDMDHLAAQAGLANESLVRAGTEAMIELIGDCGADAVVDFCNPFACIAAKATRTPLFEILQADMHPASKGFIWWRDPPAGLPGRGDHELRRADSTQRVGKGRRGPIVELG